MTSTELRKQFVEQTSEGKEFRLFIKVVRKPSGTLETIINTENIADEIKYVLETYGDDFKMRKNPNVAIVNYILM